MDVLVEYTLKLAMASQTNAATSLSDALPLTFKKLGLHKHKQFDQLSLDADSFGDGPRALAQLAHVMENCIACHAAYHLEIKP